MHNVNVMLFPDEIIRTNKQTGQIVHLRNIVCGPTEPTVPQLESWANGASGAFNMHEANGIWIQHEIDHCSWPSVPRSTYAAHHLF